ncbi:MAG: ATP-binding protein [Spirochaetes bacterium]|nr:ATP-binding protein [Spirochaetota bacterium]
MIISIASGKGGTGKTTMAVNLAMALKYAQLIDCDVEEPNAHIFLKPSINHIEDVNVLVPKVNYQFCTFCGKCSDFCKFNALAVMEKQVLIFPELCHNCGGCRVVCPENAISEYEISIGKIRKGQSRAIDFLDGYLDIARPSPVPIIKKLKSLVSVQNTVIIDSPPGTSCSMVESIEGSDYCLLVTEPTPFGLNDLKLAIDVVKKLNIPFGVIINQSDIGDQAVKQFCDSEGIEVVMEVPYSRKVAQAYSRGRAMIEELPEYKARFQSLYDHIKDRIK